MNEVTPRLVEEVEKLKLRLADQMNACADEADFLLAKAKAEPVACLRIDYGKQATRMFNATCGGLRMLAPPVRRTIAVVEHRGAGKGEDIPPSDLSKQLAEAAEQRQHNG
jgi:hypothetical protein